MGASVDLKIIFPLLRLRAQASRGGLFGAQLATLGAMPSAHRNALKTLIESIKQRIAKDEAALLRATTDEERTKLVGEIADLHVRHDELMNALSGEID
jgi:hypothetical protein